MNNRKSEIRNKKINSLIFLILVFAMLVYNDYEFNNYIINGLALFLVSSLMLYILFSHAFYIEFGMQMYSEEAKEKILIYSKMRPFWTLYNKIMGILLYSMLFISLILILIGIADYFK